MWASRSQVFVSPVGQVVSYAMTIEYVRGKWGVLMGLAVYHASTPEPAIKPAPAVQLLS